MIIWLNPDEFLDKYGNWCRNLWELLWVNAVNQKEKLDIINDLNDRVNVLVNELYGD